MRKKASKLIIVCSLLSLLLACQNTYLTQSKSDDSSNQYLEFIHTGDVLPIDKVTTIDGRELNLHALGKKKLIILFATWCSDSNRLMHSLNSSPLLNDDTIEVIAIAREEDNETVKAWQQARNSKVALAVDVDRTLYEKFASGGIPRVITVDENNQIIKMNLAEKNNQLSQIIW